MSYVVYLLINLEKANCNLNIKFWINCSPHNLKMMVCNHLGYVLQFLLYQFTKLFHGRKLPSSKDDKKDINAN